MKEYKEELKHKIELPEEKLPGVLLSCPNCNSHIHSDNINIQKAIAKCNQCHRVFEFEQDLRTNDSILPEVFMPAGLDVFRLGKELNIHLKWKKAMKKSGSIGFLIFFALVWNVILIPVFIGGVLGGNLIVPLLTFFHFITGIYLIFYVLAFYFNTTHIIIDEERLKILHSPIRLPFFNQKNVKIKDIEQLYVRKIHPSKSDRKKTPTFALYVILKNQEKMKLLHGMNKETQMYLEKEIESYLHIKNRPIQEEITE